MRKALVVFLVVLSLPVSAYVVFAQADHQVDDKGYIEIGSFTESAAKKRPIGSLYTGAGVLVYEGKPPKPYIQHDMGGYELDPAPEADRNKPYDKHDFSHVWSGLPGAGGGNRTPPMTDAGYAAFEQAVVAGGPRGNLSLAQPVNEPDLMCDPSGYPGRVSAGGGGVGPMEFFQIPTMTLIHKSFHDSWSKIWTDGRLLPKPPLDPAFAGYSVGKWVETPGVSTFVVDTNGVDDRTWMGGGLRHTLDATFQVRWRRIDHNTLQHNVTIKDPAYYKETWEQGSGLMELYPNLEADIWPCVPSDELKYRSLSPTEVPDAGKK